MRSELAVSLVCHPQVILSKGLTIRSESATSALSQKADSRGLGSGQLKGEQLQYALRTKSTREQEFTHGHGSPAATDCQCVFCHSWPVRRCRALCPGTRRLRSE